MDCREIYHIVRGLEHDLNLIANYATVDRDSIYSLDQKVRKACSLLAKIDTSASDYLLLRSKISKMDPEVSAMRHRQLELSRCEADEKLLGSSLVTFMATVLKTNASNLRKINDGNIKVRLIAITILGLLEKTGFFRKFIFFCSHPDFALLDHPVFVSKEYPKPFQPLVKAISSLEAKIPSDKYKAIACQLVGKKFDPRIQPYVNEIMTEAKEIAEQEAFLKIIDKAIKFYQKKKETSLETAAILGLTKLASNYSS